MQGQGRTATFGIAQQGLTILVVEQFAAEVLKVADSGALLINGRITYHGAPDVVGDMISSAYLGGEHAPEVRTRAAAGLGFLGVALDEERNLQTSADGEIGGANATVRTLVLSAHEDLEIARQVRALLAPRR